MKKHVLAMMMGLLLMAGVLAGCGNKEAEPENDVVESETVADQTAPAEEVKTDETADQTTDKAASESQTDTQEQDAAANVELLTGKHHVEIEVENYGTIAVELDADKAPISVTNFVNLAKEGFYDGLTYHRIIPQFMIQGGDPLGNGTGGADTMIRGEFASNGVENDLSHTRGAISMARSAQPDSASSQFFIVHEDSQFLDGEYAAFGYVTEGIEIVDKICEDIPVEDDNGTVLPENQPKITKITVID